jgi:ribonuclease P protein component
VASGVGRSNGFTPRQRLLSAKDFERVYARRRRVSDDFFSVNYAPGTGGYPRLGLSVGAKLIGTAVARNRVKRTVRDSFRLHQHQLPTVDLIVGARAMARSAHNARLRESLAELWKKIALLCAASSAD